MNQREIKFRAWDGVKFHYFTALSGLYGIIPIGSIQQYTGRKDKHGKEIYEGDVVRWRSTHKGASGGDHVDEMKWIDEQACFMLIPFVHEPYAADMEVLGNIYEHKHLLETKSL